MTQAEASSEAAPSTTARPSRRHRSEGTRNGHTTSGTNARYPVSKCRATVSMVKSTAGNAARSDDRARYVKPHASGSVHDAHNCVHTP